MGAHSHRAERIILLGPSFWIYLAVAHLTRELLVGLNEAGHRGQQLGVGGGEGGTGPHQFFQHSLLCGSIRSKGVKIFVKSSSEPGWTISLIWSGACLSAP